MRHYDGTLLSTVKKEMFKMIKITAKRSSGFTMIELMVGIFVTLSALATFYALYTNSLKSHRNTNVRIAVNILGEQMIETIASSIRLMGLNNEYMDFSSGSIIIDSDGGSGNDAVNFRYLSPFGGPIAKIYEVSGDNGNCTYKIVNSASLDSEIDSVHLFTRNGILRGTVPSGGISGDQIQTTATTPVFAGPCADTVPLGTLLAGPDNTFLLTYVNTGTRTILRLERVLAGGGTEAYVDFDSDNNPDYQMPFLVLEFLREFNDGTITRREWFPLINDPVQLGDVKSVRIGFVVVSQQDRVKKKVASSDPGITSNYCPFDNRCYSLTDLNKTAYVFRRVIHIKNYDFLGRQR